MNSLEAADVNVILAEYLNHPAYAQVIAARLARLGGTILLLTGEAEHHYLLPALLERGIDLRWLDWDFGQEIYSTWAETPSSRLVVFRFPTLPEHWTELQSIRHQFGSRVIGINELLLPVSVLMFARETLPYATENLYELVGYLTGQTMFGADLSLLTAAFPLRGKSVIEFGPLDASQTAFLASHGTSRVMCIEARPENAMKVLAARQALGWNNVDVRMDDFHNVDANNVGRFDLAFAHGVYYHAIAPFVFLENLISLADNIFLGGFCATDENPPAPYVMLEHNGHEYRAKRYEEGGRGDFHAGINTYAYFFHADDLLRFLDASGYKVNVLQDQTFGLDQCAGRYLRLLATRR